MTTLGEKLKRVLAFDEKEDIGHGKGSDLQIKWYLSKDRLAPIHDQLVKVVGIGQDMSPHSDQCIGSTYPCCENQLFHRTLAGLVKVLEGNND